MVLTRSRIKLSGPVVVMMGMAACVPNEAPSPEANKPAASTAPAAKPPPQGAPNYRAATPRQPMMRPMPFGNATAPDAAHQPSPMAPGAPAGNASAPTSVSAAPPASVAAPAPSPAGTGALIKDVFLDRFDRPAPGPDWNLTSPVWRIESGRLCGQGARNHPAWLARRLPTNARIEFEAMSRSPDGDLKVEVWGDGKSFAKGTSYTDASSYIAIFGGWKNQFHVLARIDEHAKDRPEVKLDPNTTDIRARPVRAHNTYYFKIERNDGKTVRWYVDDIEILSFSDPKPLKGAGHEHVGFNNWEVPVCFDNLKITPLEGV